jgi:hypothetical protein
MGLHFIYTALIVWSACTIYLFDKIGFKNYIRLILGMNWRMDGEIQPFEIFSTLIVWQLHLFTLGIPLYLLITRL